MKEKVSPAISNASATADERFYPLVGDVLQEGNTRTKVQGKERRPEVKREKAKGGKATR